MRILEIRDMGPDCEYPDRYCVVLDQIETYHPNFSYYAINMTDTGTYNHVAASLGDHLGDLISFDDLPEPCQANLIEEFEDIYIDEIDTGFDDEDDDPEIFYQQRENEKLIHAFQASGRELALYNEDDD